MMKNLMILGAALMLSASAYAQTYTIDNGASVNWNTISTNSIIILRDGTLNFTTNNGVVSGKTFETEDVGGAMFLTNNYTVTFSNVTFNVEAPLIMGNNTGNTVSINLNDSTVVNVGDLTFTTAYINVNEATLAFDANSKMHMTSSAEMFLSADSVIQLDLGSFASSGLYDWELVTSDGPGSYIGLGSMDTVVGANGEVFAKTGTDEFTYVSGYNTWTLSFAGEGLSLNLQIPEPSTYAAIFGALALALAVYRRKK